MARTKRLLGKAYSYTKIVWDIVDRAMMHQTTFFQFLFMKNIERVGGLSKVKELVHQGGRLHNRIWAMHWYGGLAELTSALEGDLRVAELNLRRAEREEQEKSRDIRLCPHCNRQFLIDQENCGQFICGRHDTHITPRNNNHGCGFQFTSHQAAFYQIDQERLQRLRETFECCNQKFKEHSTMNQLWDCLNKTSLPYVLSKLDLSTETDCFYPISVANTNACIRSHRLRHLLLTKSYFHSFACLPDLVEFYTLIHTMFQQRFSFADVENKTIEQIMQRLILAEKFEDYQVTSFLALYHRVKRELNKFLVDVDFTIQYECEQVKVFVDGFEKANFLSILSYNENLNEGLDDLILIINHIIQIWNSFIPALDPKVNSEITATSLLGYQYSGVMKAFSSLESDLEFIIRQSWKCGEDGYDLQILEDHMPRFLSSALFLLKAPLIFLRKRFYFKVPIQDITDYSHYDLKGEILHGECSNGLYFTQLPDSQLYKTCASAMKVFQSQPGNEQCTHATNYLSMYHMLDYESMRGILQAIKNMVEAKLMQSGYTLRDSCQLDMDTFFRHFGFPSSLPALQKEMILSLKPDSMVEFIEFIGYQLASESFHFSSLPLYLKNLLPSSVRCDLEMNLNLVLQRNGRLETSTLISDFRKDVLMFYERVLRYQSFENASIKLKKFLLDNNCCDNQDLIFAAIPDSVQLRHYVDLNQKLHQMNLQILYSENIEDEIEKNITAMDEAKISKCFVQPSPGNCWLLSQLTSDEDDLGEINATELDILSTGYSMGERLSRRDIECNLQREENNSWEESSLSSFVTASSSLYSFETCKSSDENSCDFFNSVE